MFIKLACLFLWIVTGLLYVTGVCKVSRLSYALVWIALIINLIGGIV